MALRVAMVVHKAVCWPPNCLQDAHSLSTDELVKEGKHIWPELQQLRLEDEKQLVQKMTKSSTDVLSTHPVIFLGWTGQGKSSIVKALLTHFGCPDRLPEVGHGGQTTMGAMPYYVSLTTKTGPGRAMFIDTEGFSASATQKVLDNAKKHIIDSGISEEVFKQRLVFVLVIGVEANGIREIEDRRTMDILKSICETFCKQKQMKARLQIVYTKDDIRKCPIDEVDRICTETVKQAVGSNMRVAVPIFIKNENGNGDVSKLARWLEDTFNQDLTSPHMLRIIRRLLAKSTIHEMNVLVKRGLESEDNLARRCAFAITRAYGKRCHAWPSPTTFAQVEHLAHDLGQYECAVCGPVRGIVCDEALEACHKDRLREHAEIVNKLCVNTSSTTSVCSDTESLPSLETDVVSEEQDHGHAEQVAVGLLESEEPLPLDSLQTSIWLDCHMQADRYPTTSDVYSSARSFLIEMAKQPNTSEKDTFVSMLKELDTAIQNKTVGHVGTVVQNKTKNNGELKEFLHEALSPEQLASMMWTADDLKGKTAMVDGKNREMCWMMNYAIRIQNRSLLKAMAPLSRALTAFTAPDVDRSGEAIKTPPLLRGGGFNAAWKAWFNSHLDQVARVPAFWPTTNTEAVAKSFRRRAQADGHEPILWRINVDEDKGCYHVQQIKHSLVYNGEFNPSETEYLFAPFSPFKIVSVNFKSDPTVDDPHEITVYAMPDGKHVPDTVELFPWH